MTTPTAELHPSGIGAILTRLEELERENRRMRRFSAMILLGIAVFLGLAAALVFFSGRFGLPGAAQMVSAQQFVLRDADGQVRGAWGTGEDGTVRFMLSDAAGHQRVRLSLLEDGSAGLSFADTAERKLAVLGLLPDNTTTLALTDAAGIPRAVLGVAANGSSNLVFADRSGSTRAGLGVDPRGQGTFTLTERGGGAPGQDAMDGFEDTEQPDTADDGDRSPTQSQRR